MLCLHESVVRELHSMLFYFQTRLISLTISGDFLSIRFLKSLLTYSIDNELFEIKKKVQLVQHMEGKFMCAMNFDSFLLVATM